MRALLQAVKIWTLALVLFALRALLDAALVGAVGGIAIMLVAMFFGASAPREDGLMAAAGLSAAVWLGSVVLRIALLRHKLDEARAKAVLEPSELRDFKVRLRS